MILSNITINVRDLDFRASAPSARQGSKKALRKLPARGLASSSVKIGRKPEWRRMGRREKGEKARICRSARQGGMPVGLVNVFVCA